MRSLRNILMVQPYGIGDSLFTTPLLRALRTLPTVQRVDLLLGSRTESVFQNNPHVDQIFSIDKGAWHREGSGRMIQEAYGLWKKLKSRYDLLIDFSMQREYGFYSQFFLGIPRRIGFDFKGRGVFLTQSSPLPNGFEGKHVIDFYCDLSNLLGLKIENRFAEFYISKQNQDEAARILAQRSLTLQTPFIALAAGGGESWGKDAVFKRWPVTHFLEMISLLKERMDFQNILVMGSEGERTLGEEIRKKSPLPVTNLSGELSLGGCAVILEKAGLFLANDGGLVHLAHALRTPLIAFYGPVDSKVYGPYPPTQEAVAVQKEQLPCRPCYVRFRYNSACPDIACLTDLKPKEVFEFLDQKNFWPVLSHTSS